MPKDDRQPIRFCPFCGSREVAEACSGLTFCKACRTNFILSYQRKLRAAPKRKDGEHHG